MSLNGKHALITGSSRGIGRGIALKLAAKGVKVAIHYYQNEAAAVDTLAQVRKLGADGLVVQADMLRPEQITRLFRQVESEFGKLDIFVSNARPEAAAFFYPPMDITLEQWDAAFDSQAKAILLGVREAASIMGKGGRILAITYAAGSRTGGLQPWVGMGSAKAAVESSRSLLRGGTRQTRNHRECDQPRLDRGQRLEHAAATGARSHQELARARVDSNGTLGHARRRRQRCNALLFRASRLDNWASDLRGCRRFIDEPGGPAGNPARLNASTSRSMITPERPREKCIERGDLVPATWNGRGAGRCLVAIG